MEALQKRPWLNGGCLCGDFDPYLLSPVTPWKLGGRCCSVKLSLKWLSVLISQPPRSQTALDLLICASGKFGSAAVSTPTPTFGVSGLQAASVRPKRFCCSQPPLLTTGPRAAGWGGRCRCCKQMSATTC